jgi:hypothetical protein
MRGLQGLQGIQGPDEIDEIGELEGFYGTIRLINETATNYSYVYRLENNIGGQPNLLSMEIFTNALQSINYNIEEYSSDRLLRPYYEYNVEYFPDFNSAGNLSNSLSNITFSISGGTFRTDANKFYFTADNNYINNGTLILRSIAVPPPPVTGTGFYGTIEIENITAPGGPPLSFQVKLAFNNEDITNYVTINGGETEIITVPYESRLPNSESFLQYKVIFDTSPTSVNDLDDIVGFTVVSRTNNPLTEENTINLLIDSGYIDGGALIHDVTVDSS